MARDTEGLKSTSDQFARTGDREELENEGITRAEGWGTGYSTAGGDNPPREIFNQLHFEIASFLADLESHGILEWHTDVDYEHPTIVYGSDFNLYRSVRSNSSVDPTTDADESDWRGFSGMGWTPVLAAVPNGMRRVLQVADWTGGDGDKPAAGQYLGSSGFVTAVADAVDFRGPAGPTGPGGADSAGYNGWSPILAGVANGERRVLRIVDWVGGEGDKPATGEYLSTSGLTSNPALATNFRGRDGADGDDGDDGAAGATGHMGQQGPTGPTGPGIPTGSIIPYGGDTDPSGWLLCDGDTVSRTKYSALFNVIGETFGNGDGSTTFELPDMRRRVPMGAGGTMSAGPGTAVGQSGGSERSRTPLPRHNHAVVEQTPLERRTGSHHLFTRDAIKPYPLTVSTYFRSGPVVSTGESPSNHDNVQPSLVLNYIIKD